MTTDTLIINARLFGDRGLQQIAIENKMIKAIAPQLNLPATTLIDLAGDWLSLGGIDLQINGGLGLAFPDLKLQDLLLDRKSVV